MQVSDARKLKALEENRRLKKLLAESMLDVATVRRCLEKTSDARVRRAAVSWAVSEKARSCDPEMHLTLRSAVVAPYRLVRSSSYALASNAHPVRKKKPAVQRSMTFQPNSEKQAAETRPT
jgi:hypothetical protein